jgi:Bacterial Ig domain
MMRLGWRGLSGFGALCKVFALSVVLTLALVSAAFADQVTNRVDTSPDAALENVTLNEGAAHTVAFRVLWQNSDDDSQCYIDSGEQLKVRVLSSNTSVATVSPQMLTFTDCNQDQSVAVTGGARGTATITVAQAPGAGSNTTGSGTYDYAPASFTVTVNNVAPTISNIADQSTNEDTSTGAIPFTVGDAGTPAGNLTSSGSSSNTTLVPDSNITFGGSGANRTVTVTPAPERSGAATITVRVSDGAATATDTFVLMVNSTNDQPNAVDDTANADEGGPNVIIGVLANDGYVDGDALTITGNTQPPAVEGSVTCSTTSCTFAPDADFRGMTSFTYRANDGTVNGNVATVMINVAAVNDAPSFDLQTNPNQTVNEDAGTQTVAGFATNASAGPANESSQTVSFAVTNDNHALFSGQPTISPSGTLTYTPTPNANGTANVTVRARDDGGTANDGDDESAPRTFAITVNAVNDIPTLTLNVNGAASASEGQTKTFSFTVTDPDPGGFTIKSGFPDCGNSGVFVSGSLTTTPTGGYFECRFPDGPAEPTVRVRVSDLQGELSNIATQNVTVADVAPTMTISGPSKAKWGQTKTFTFAITDPGEDTFDFAASYPSCGTGAILVSENMDSHGGSFKCKFIQLAKSTLAVRVEDLDGGLSNMASWQVTVKKKK